MTNPINPPAFPSNISNGFDTLAAGLHPGMTLRDLFAGQAMAGLCAYYGAKEKPIYLAERAYSHADAMLAEREKL